MQYLSSSFNFAFNLRKVRNMKQITKSRKKLDALR